MKLDGGIHFEYIRVFDPFWWHSEGNQKHQNLKAPKAKSGYKQVISDGKLDGGIYSC